MHVSQGELNYTPFWRFSSSIYLKLTHLVYMYVFLTLPFAPQIRTSRAILCIPVSNRVNYKPIQIWYRNFVFKKEEEIAFVRYVVKKKKKKQIIHFHTKHGCSIKQCLKGLQSPFNFLKGSLEFSLDPLRT